MPRYIFATVPLGLIYADTKDMPEVTGETPIEALRQVDAGIGETHLDYAEVERGSRQATFDVYRAVGIVRVVNEDATYVTSIRVSQPLDAKSTG